MRMWKAFVNALPGSERKQYTVIVNMSNYEGFESQNKKLIVATLKATQAPWTWESWVHAGDI